MLLIKRQFLGTQMHICTYIPFYLKCIVLAIRTLRHLPTLYAGTQKIEMTLRNNRDSIFFVTQKVNLLYISKVNFKLFSL